MKTLSTIFLLALSISIGSTFAKAIVGERSARITQSFDSDWRFTKGDPANAEKTDFDDSSWRRLDVPHDWSIEGPFDAKNPTSGSGGFLPSGVAWYRKHFTVPAAERGNRVFIDFDGVMGISDVWINGFHLGQRPSGYISVAYDLTGHISFGKDNVIAVKADTAQQPASRWYTGAGIYRHVRLAITDAVHLARWSTFVTTPKVSDTEATVNVASNIVNQSGRAATASVEVRLFGPMGNAVAQAETKSIEIKSGGSMVFDLNLPVKAPKRWNLETPFLYKALVTIRSENQAIDSETVSFGIRSFEFVSATGFWLNGKNFKIKGACLHHDGSAFGAAVPLAVWEYRLNQLRKLGVNAIRTAHNPPSPEFLDLTDRMGFLVMDELFDQWTLGKNPYDYHLYFNEWSKADVRDTVRRDRNHPSVIIYSAGNEIRDNHGDQEKAKQTLHDLVDTFHENDLTRPVTQALFRPNIEGARDYDNGLAEILDVVGQNYREKEILAAYKQNPKRKILGTENTHDLNQWLALRDNPEYSGQFIWVGVDYLGESAAWPNYAYGKGLLDRTATPRPIGYQRQSWWSSTPMVYMARRVAPATTSPTDPGYEVAEQRRTQTLFSDWTPKNLAEHEENVEVYSNCDEVELFLNGRSLGPKPKNADDSPRNWKVNFEPGKLRGLCKNSGKMVTGHALRTAGKPARIILVPNKEAIENDWNDVVYVTARVADAKGVVVPDANQYIEFSVTGSGVIAAVDSGDNADHDPFQATKRKAFQGSCVAVVRANKDVGSITVTARSGQLAAGTTRLMILQ